MHGLGHSSSMWMAERHLEFFMGLGRQRVHPKGSMVYGYMVYHNMMYISEYLHKLASKLNLCCTCDRDSNNNLKGEYLIGKGRSRKLKGNY